MAKQRPNVIPIIEDARHPQKYRMLVPMVDVVFADVAQPDQARIVALNAQHFLKNGGHFVISIKASCIDSTAQPEAVFAREVKKLQEAQLKPREQVRRRRLGRAGAGRAVGAALSLGRRTWARRAASPPHPSAVPNALPVTPRHPRHLPGDAGALREGPRDGGGRLPPARQEEGLGGPPRPRAPGPGLRAPRQPRRRARRAGGAKRPAAPRAPPPRPAPAARGRRRFGPRPPSFLFS
jgi:hypothetical protein